MAFPTGNRGRRRTSSSGDFTDEHFLHSPPFDQNGQVAVRYPLRISQPVPHLINNYFEQKFSKIIHQLGTYKIRKRMSNLLLIYYEMKLNCKTARCDYGTVVVGDEFGIDEVARQNVFRKGYFALRKEFRRDLEDAEKAMNAEEEQKFELMNKKGDENEVDLITF